MNPPKSVKMIIPTLLLSLAIGRALSQTTPTCPSITNNAVRGAFNAFADHDPHFVYDRSNCSSTSQRVINQQWENDCEYAVKGLCNSTSPNSAVINRWTWATYNNGSGAGCQVGMWQPEPSSTERFPVGITSECCLSAFQTMLGRLGSEDASDDLWKRSNRRSVNIAEGGYPFAQTTYDTSQVFANGVQVTPGYPSFIVQGLVH